MLVSEPPVTFEPLPTIVLFPDVMIDAPFWMSTPAESPAMTELAIITTDCGPLALIAFKALRIFTLLYVAFTVPVPDVLNALIAALLNEKNSDSETKVAVWIAELDCNEPSVRMP